MTKRPKGKGKDREGMVVAVVVVVGGGVTALKGERSVCEMKMCWEEGERGG